MPCIRSQPVGPLQLILGALVLLAAAPMAARQVASASGDQQAHFGTRTEAVLVDVSVTDRKGRQVTDLTQADFQVFEDAVPQKILTFARHQPNPNATSADAAEAAGIVSTTASPTGRVTGAPAARGPSVVALAFDRLSPDGRMLAYQAAKQFIKDKQPDELAGVFIVDQALGVVSPYTTDATKLEAAVDRVAKTATTQLARSERNPELAQFYSSPDVPWVAGAEQAGRSAGDQPWVDPIGQVESGAVGARGADGARLAEVQVLRALQRMERSYSDMMYEMQGQASMNALLALVDSLGALDGRKAVIYFCEGLTIPPSVQPKFRAIIDNANRLNVTVYSIDAAGLRVQSKQAETLRTVQQIGAMGIGDIKRENMSAKYSDALEDNERALTLDPAVSLGILASQTGGLLINNTNDLAHGIQTIDTDRRNYYLLSYSPTNPAEDGTFRKISVIVNRPRVEVRARSGYRAVPSSDAGPVLAYETPALSALGATPPPKDFPVDVGAYSVPMPGRPGLSAIVANVPGSSLSFLTNVSTGKYSGEVVILARVGGVPGELPRKLSQQYNLTGDLDHLAGTKSKRILFLRTPQLAPGSHPVEVAVHDGPAHRDTVIGTSLTIPVATRPVVGDLILVDHAEKVDGDSAPGNPLVANDLMLIPAFQPTVHKSERKEVNFAISLLLEPGAPLPEAGLALVFEGTPISSVPLPLLPPDAEGRLLAVGRVPIGSIPAGRYDLQVTLGTGEHAQRRKAALTIAP
jgi:VWFA-related protein